MTFDDTTIDDDDDNIVSLNARLRKQWQKRALRTDKGKIIPNYANAILALRCDPDVRDAFGYDDMERAAVMRHEIARVDTANRLVTDTDIRDLHEWLQQHGMQQLKLGDARNAVQNRAHECRFHPVIDYLMSLQWDGVPRLGVWLTSYLGAELNPANQHIGRMFLTAMVARVLQPGCQADYMMVLEGPQGILKSSACRVLGGEWFSDHLPDVTSGKEVSQHIKGKWLVEVAEMHAMSRAEATQLKSFISRPVEIYRPSYGYMEVREPRQCVFIGTTNEDQYLKDTTGGRRFWPVKTGITGRIDLDLLAYNRDQLFAEALDNFNNHGTWWPDASFEAEYLKPEQAARLVGDIWEDRIDEFLVGKTRVTIAEVAREALAIIDGRMTGNDTARITSVLRSNGWLAKRTGRRRWWELA